MFKGMIVKYVSKFLDELDLNQDGIADKEQVLGIIERGVDAVQSLFGSLNFAEIAVVSAEAAKISASVKKILGILEKSVDKEQAKAAFEALKSVGLELLEFVKPLLPKKA